MQLRKDRVKHVAARICEYCGCVFEVSVSALKRKGGGTYCSVKCAQDSKRFPRNETCAYCGGPLGKKQKSKARYCSRRCAALANNNIHLARAREAGIAKRSEGPKPALEFRAADMGDRAKDYEPVIYD